MSTPRLPAEWEEQSAVQLTWPHEGTDWADNLADTLPVFAQIGAAITRFETLLCVVNNDAHAEQVKQLLLDAGADLTMARFAQAPCNDTWARDHGALTAIDENDQPIINDFIFNGWGNKYPAELDTQITQALIDQQVLNGTHLPSPLVLEGGAIETDGQGTLLATRSSILNTNRNGDLSQEAMEAELTQRFGFSRYLWLSEGEMTGDDTDAHIDVLARFTSSNDIVFTTADTSDEDYWPLHAMQKELQAFTNLDGASYRLHALPPAGELYDEDGRRLSASYANFLIINGAVLLPVYGVDADEKAIKVLQDLFTDREIIPINCRRIIEQNGSLHCLTMQYPAQLAL